jgi:hypothetical protein
VNKIVLLAAKRAGKCGAGAAQAAPRGRSRIEREHARVGAQRGGRGAASGAQPEERARARESAT